MTENLNIPELKRKYFDTHPEYAEQKRQLERREEIKKMRESADNKARAQGIKTQLESGHKDFSGLDLSYLEIWNANFSDCNLENTILDYTILGYTNFKGANLKHASLIGVIAQDGNFNYTNLENANLNESSLCRSTFNHSNMNYATLMDADYDGILFWDTDMKGVQRSQTKKFDSICNYCNAPVFIKDECVTCWQSSLVISRDELPLANYTELDFEKGVLPDGTVWNAAPGGSSSMRFSSGGDWEPANLCKTLGCTEFRAGHSISTGYSGNDMAFMVTSLYCPSCLATQAAHKKYAAQEDTPSCGSTSSIMKYVIGGIPLILLWSCFFWVVFLIMRSKLWH